MLTLDKDSTEAPCRDVRTRIAQARQGDAAAFGELCEEFESRLLRQAILLCGDACLAEDLSQETLIEAWKCLGRYNDRCQFFTWLCAILHNRHHRILRRKKLYFLVGLANSAQQQTTMVQEGVDDAL